MKSENYQNITDQKPKQVVYVWNYLEWGGAQVYFLGIASRIKDKTKVKFVFPKGTDQQFINFCENLGFEYEFIELIGDFQPAPTLIRKIAKHRNKVYDEFRLLEFLKKFDLSESILHIELTPWQSVTALTKLCRRGGQIFVTMHNALPKVAKWRERLWKIKFARIAKFENFHLFSSNQDAKNSLAPFVSKEFLDKTTVTYTNVNPDEVEEALQAKFDRSEILEKFGLPKDRTLIFCLGQFIDRKGRWVFLEAAKKLLAKHRDLAFVWISNSVLTEPEKAKIESYKIVKSFFLIKSEHVGREHLDLMKFLRLADIYTLPSYVEGLPISLLEAMSLGIPSISTNVYAIPEAIKNGETGILVEPGDSDALAGAIELLKNDESLRQRLGARGRKWVLANFNEKTVAEIAFQKYRDSF